METIEVKMENVLCSESTTPVKQTREEVAKDYILVLNGIVFDCANTHLSEAYTGFCEGTRNTIAVDLTVCATMLGLDPEEVLDLLVALDVIDPLDDDEDTYERVKRVSDYKDRFSWDWMINPNYYLNVAAAALPVCVDGQKFGDKTARMPIYFKLV